MKTEQELRLVALDFARCHQKEHEETLEIAEAYFKFLSQTTETVTPSTIPG